MAHETSPIVILWNSSFFKVCGDWGSGKVPNAH